METGIKNSFIPHDVSQPASAERVREGSLLDLVVLVSVVLLVASLVLAAGVFLYQQYLDQSSASKINQLKIAKAQFDPALIEEFSRLDDRMRDADTILGSHIAPSVFFHMLEANTLKTVSFRSLDFETGNEDGMTIKMDGIAESVNSIALQADYFSKVGIITSPIFSNINRQLDGVRFSFSGIVNAPSIRYSQVAAGNNAAPTLAPSQPQSSPAQPSNQQQ
ncbi:MAG: hypothetical protein Q7S01_02600 [bacterium]|nr:hypothetical protein [bacterium]